MTPPPAPTDELSPALMLMFPPLPVLLWPTDTAIVPELDATLSPVNIEILPEAPPAAKPEEISMEPLSIAPAPVCNTTPPLDNPDDSPLRAINEPPVLSVLEPACMMTWPVLPSPLVPEPIKICPLAPAAALPV